MKTSIVKMKMFSEVIFYGSAALISISCTCINAWLEHLVFAYFCAIVALVNMYSTFTAVARGVRNHWGMK